MMKINTVAVLLLLSTLCIIKEAPLWAMIVHMIASAAVLVSLLMCLKGDDI